MFNQSVMQRSVRRVVLFPVFNNVFNVNSVRTQNILINQSRGFRLVRRKAQNPLQQMSSLGVAVEPKPPTFTESWRSKTLLFSWIK